MLGEWKAQIIAVPGGTLYRIYLMAFRQNQVLYLTKDGDIKTKLEGEAPIDTEALYFAEMSDDQLQAFAQGLADKGIKTNNDSIAQGKLLATEKHLEDMRTIALSKYKVKGE